MGTEVDGPRSLRKGKTKQKQRIVTNNHGVTRFPKSKFRGGLVTIARDFVVIVGAICSLFLSLGTLGGDTLELKCAANRCPLLRQQINERVAQTIPCSANKLEGGPQAVERLFEV